jgi:3-isopropylmalate/(R)-2-methylmalate dehydratase small subunit
MKPFERLHAVALPVAQPNLDTDQIIPARYLQKPRADDFGRYLFRDLRYRQDGSEDPGFLLNQPPYREARVVVAERNFACGSSREHAVWALHDYGIRAVIAPSFGDIFHSNALKNGLLPIVLPAAVVSEAIAALLARPGSAVDVDLEARTVTAPDGSVHGFAIDPFSRHCLLHGLDELDYTLGQLEHIAEFERRYEAAWTREPGRDEIAGKP